MAKKQKTVKPPKEPAIQEIAGITGEGRDYAVYHLSQKEKLVGYLIGFALGFFMIFIFFANLIASLIAGALFGFFAVPVYQKSLQSKRVKRMRIQFGDFLSALSASYSAGSTALGGFQDAYEEMKQTHGETAEFTEELLIIQKGLVSNFRLEDLLQNMADRIHLEVVANFVDTFNICYKRGGEVKKIVNETRQIINDQMDIEMEIETSLTENKNSINIIAIMPFIIVTMLRFTGNEAIVGNSPLNITIKIVSLVIFVFSYLLGKKIMDIRF